MKQESFERLKQLRFDLEHITNEIEDIYVDELKLCNETAIQNRFGAIESIHIHKAQSGWLKQLKDTYNVNNADNNFGNTINLLEKYVGS